MNVQDAETIENFYGVYLLYCKNPKYLGRVYIGKTTDPNRRIKQHNKGKHAGGAWKTSKRGPWLMVMIIHGFPNEIATLRFEWAWQHPHVSRRLKHVSKKKTKETTFDFTFRVLSEMLKVPPWNRLPLTIRWLNEEFARDFPVDKSPPIHMPICYGNVISKKLTNTQNENNCETSEQRQCVVCCETIDEKPVQCLKPECRAVSHVVCLSKRFLENGEFVPIEGKCPKCGEIFLWGDLIRKYKGCYENLDITVDCNEIYDSE